MRTPRRLPYAIPLWLTLITLGSLQAAESKQNAGQTEMSAAATKAFPVLYDLPTIGLEKSVVGLEQIIAAHHRLAEKGTVAERQLSLIIADAVAYALVSEMQRAELTRRGLGQDLTPPSVPFDKMTVVRLWKANMPDFASLIRKTLPGKDLITTHIAQHSSAEDVLSGRMVETLRDETIQARFSDLSNKVLVPIGLPINPSPDEQLIFALTRWQNFRDLTVVINMYEKGNLPENSNLLQSAFDEMLKHKPERRVDDGMNNSSFKAWLAFDQYYPTNEKYPNWIIGMFAPYTDDPSVLPEHIQKPLAELARWKARAAAKAAARAPAQPPAITNHVLAVAYTMGAQFKAEGYVYPESRLPEGTKTVGDKQFVLKLVERLVPDLSTTNKVRILMGDLSLKDIAADKDGIVSGGDPRTKGVQQALVDQQRGEVVALAAVQPGDLIQRWVYDAHGRTWFGYAGIIERVQGEGEWLTVWIYGSNANSHGIGTWPQNGVRLAAKEARCIYIIRIKE